MRGMAELAALLEAFLFVKGEPVMMSELTEVLREKEARIGAALNILRNKYDKPDAGIMLRETGSGFALTTKGEYDQWLTEMVGKQAPLSAAALETLAVIAGKEPVTRAEIERVRGVSAGRILVSLAEKDLVEERGRLDVPGHPILYGTTKRFLRCIGLGDVSELRKKWANAYEEGDLF